MDIYIKGRNGFISVCYEDETVKEELKGFTNNQLEWKALIKAMEIIDSEYRHLDKINIFMDSVLLFRQLNAIYRIKSKILKPFYFEWNRFKNILREVVEINYCFCSKTDNLARKSIK